MSKVRPSYPAEFKQQMVELVLAGRTPAEPSREFNVTAQSITNWVGQAAIDSGQPQPGKESRHAQHRRRDQPTRDHACRGDAGRGQDGAEGARA